MSSFFHDPLHWVGAELARLDEEGLRRILTTREGPQGPQISLDGCRLVNFGGNDYLGLASHPRIVVAAGEAMERLGWGSGASPLLSGRSSAHDELERCVAAFEDEPAALLFPSGFAANAGTIAALVDEGDAIFADAKNHASLIDGCRLSRARRFLYPHADAEALDELVQRAGDFRRRLIVTDGLFSMDGDLAPLRELGELATRHQAMLLVDEAHATGVFGENGRGVCEHSLSPGGAGSTASLAGGSAPPISAPPGLIRVGTLSKALGSAGGFVCGRRELIDWLAQSARSYVFSTAAPPALAAAGIAAIKLVQQEPERRRSLLARAAQLREELRAQGWDTGGSISQIIPLRIGEAGRTMRVAAALRSRGLFVPGIRPPTVPQGESLLRVSLCWHHSEEAVQRLLDAMDEVRRL